MSLIKVLKSVNDKINTFLTPTNLSVSNTTTLGTYTTIGRDDNDELIVNSTSTFQAPVTSPRFIIPATSEFRKF